MERERLTQRIKEAAYALGFDAVGVARAEPLSLERARLSRWLSEGMHGTMAWMERHEALRGDPRALLPEAESVVCVAMNYHHPLPESSPPAPQHGRISRYAWGDDYHEVLRERLYRLLERVETWSPGVKGRVCVDSAPIMEKAWGVRAGLGWLGKHTNLILPRKGSWFFLGELLLSVVLTYDAPLPDHCGTCTRCLEACPTGALPAPYLLDARRCISYLTIEHRGEIDPELARGMENWIFGCDVCQEVCPWNRFETPSSEPAFAPRPDNVSPPLDELADLDEAAFRTRFRKSPVKRTKWAGFQRNVRIARSNTPSIS